MYDELTEQDIKKMEEEIEYRKLVVRKQALEAVKEATGASTHCGGCEPRVEELIEEFK